MLSENVQSIGVTLGNTLSFNAHVNEVYRALRHHTGALRHDRKCISNDDAKTERSCDSVDKIRLLQLASVYNVTVYSCRTSSSPKQFRLSGQQLVKRGHITPVLHGRPALTANRYTD